ncbi:MAG TPA: PP2C family protein-serine/threonine phosphatase, partial [Leptospiraceae bacterium]|nr:PP2C family protein-serine/threonine phosphatase [Leptospiraceae bacterium]
MVSQSPIRTQEELESERRFSLFSFYTQWAVFCLFLIYKFDLNIFVILSSLSFTAFRFLAILPSQKNSKRIYLLNHLASLSLICFFTFFFSAAIKNESNVFLDWQLYYIALSFTVIHESMRVHRYSYLFLSGISLLIYTGIVFSVPELANLDITYKLIIPYLFITYCASLGFFINRSRREAIRYYVDLLQEKIAMTKDMALARNVHESLFPKITTIKGLKFTVFRKSHNQIGGDFYDFVQLREGNIGIFITDVAGHGYSSAMVAAMIKVMVSTLPYFLKLDPSGLLSFLDKKISGEFNSHHATALYLFIDFQNKKFLLANAGHPYFIYAKKGEDFKEIETFGTLLGFGLQDPVAATQEFNYESGDRFLIYTDGLIEGVNSKDELLESSGLLRILNKHK